MKKHWMILICAGLLGATFGGILAPAVRASEFDEKTIFTFSEPVEIPGKVLPAGTYVFTLLDSEANRDIVQVWNKDQTQLIGTYLAISDERLQPTDKTVVTFSERPTGSPEAIQAWFYPGRLSGEEFVYPKTRATSLAMAARQPVLSMPDEHAANLGKPAQSTAEPSVQAMKQAPVKAVQPTGEEVEFAMIAQIPAEASPLVSAIPQTLPKTASELPLVALAGLACLGLAGAFRLAARVTN